MWDKLLCSLQDVSETPTIDPTIMPWDTNNPDLPYSTKRRILARDGYQCVAIMRDTGQRCTATTTLEVDHIINQANFGTNNDNNLQTLCHWHHNLKTQLEARNGRMARKKPNTAKHPGEL